VVSEDPSAGAGQSAFDILMDSGAEPPRPEVSERARAKRNLKSSLTPSDLVFRAIARSGGSLVLVIMILVGTFLAYRATRALHTAGWSFLTTQAWNPDGGSFGIAAVMVGTFLIAVVAIMTAIPLPVGTALYISEYAPPSIKHLLISAIDLMAAVPSVIFGLWGFKLLQWQLAPLSRWLGDWFYWFPLFQVNGVDRNSPAPSLTTLTRSFLPPVASPVTSSNTVRPTRCSMTRKTRAPPTTWAAASANRFRALRA
jgi:phosphate transport system permease protein